MKQKFYFNSLHGIACHFIVLYGISWYCMVLYWIVFDIIALYCMSPHRLIVLQVLYLIRFYCTVSQCDVPLLQRAGELPRSASSHFILHHESMYEIASYTKYR